MNSTIDMLKNHVRSIAQDITNPADADWWKEYQEDNDGEDPSAMDYLTDALDIEYIVSRDKEYIGARILVAFGGPTIWINTRNNTIEGYWGGDSASASFDDNLGLDETLEELFDC